MINIFKQFLLFAFIIIITCGCLKPKIEKYYLSPYERSFGAFKNGSYWIYQNDSTLTQDSIYVNELYSKMESITSDGELRVLYEVNSSVLSSSIFPHSNFYYTLDSWGNNGSFNFLNLYVSYRIQNNSLSAMSSYNINYLASELVNGFTFYSVYIITRNDFPPYLEQNNGKIYIVSNVGVIKWILTNNNGSTENWSLIRYSIVQ